MLLSFNVNSTQICDIQLHCNLSVVVYISLRLLSQIDILLLTLQSCRWYSMSVCTSVMLLHYYCVKLSASETNVLFSINLWPLEPLWSAVSLWKTNFILHSWQIHIAFKSSGCMGNIHLGYRIYWLTNHLHSYSSIKSFRLKYVSSSLFDTSE